nr:epsin 1 [Hymenolepis microstoma]
MVFKRLNDKCKNWRHIYKALHVIEACLQYGSLAFVKECRSQLPQILTLCDFVYSYDRNSNAGFLIREKAQRVAALLKDENLLKQERQAVKSERPSRHSTYARPPMYLGASEGDDQVETPSRSRSVYNPSDEYVARSCAEEWEQMRMAMPSRAQESSQKSSKKLDANNKPTLLESSRKAANTRSEDLLLFDDPPPKSGRFNAWLESRSKRLSNMSTSDICTPSSSLIDSGSNANEKSSASAFGIKSNVLDDLSGLDFGPLSITQEKEPNSFEGFSAQTTAKVSTHILSSPSNIPILQTSADEYFESRAKENKTSTTFSAETIKTVEDLHEPEKTEVGANHNESSKIAEKTTSKLSTILSAHKDLVDLENIVTIQKPPPANTVALFGDSNYAQNEVFTKPSFLELGGSTDWHSSAQPVLTNQLVPMCHEQQTLGGQSQHGTLYAPTPATNRIASKSTNPFL